MADTLSVYFPKGKKKLINKLAQIAKRQDRSVNYIVVRAIEAHVKREERR